MISKNWTFSSGWTAALAVEEGELRLVLSRDGRSLTLSCGDSLTLESVGTPPAQDGVKPVDDGIPSVPGARKQTAQAWEFRPPETAPGTVITTGMRLLGGRVSAWEEGETLELHACPTSSEGLPLAGVMAHYRVEPAGENALRFTTWFGSHDPVNVTSLSWMALRMDKSQVKRCCGLDPKKAFDRDELSHPVRFGSAAVTFEGGYAMLSHCGEVDWIPNIGTYEGRTTQCILGVRSGRLAGQDIRTFDAAHPLSAVLSFGEGEPRLPQVGEACLPACAVPQGETYTLRSGLLTAAVRVRDQGVSLLGVRLDDFSPDETASLLPLTTLELLDLQENRSLLLDSENGWERVRIRAGEKRLSVYLEKPRGIDLAVSLEARSAGEDTIEWRTQVLNNSARYSVLRASYPPVCFAGGGDVTLFKSLHSGALTKHAYAREERWTARYPSGFSGTMPVFGVYDPARGEHNGLYAAIHAPAAAQAIERCAFFRRGQGYFSYDYPAEQMGRPYNSFSLNGALVVKAFSGDWYDMAKIYGAYVHEHAEWCPPVGREDSPAWMRDVPMYIMDWMPNDNPDADPVPISIRPATEPKRDNWVSKPIELADRLGLPIGYHLYNWHFIPFNNDFPFYFPVKEGLAEGVLRMKEHGIHVMPYINGRIADTRDTRGETVRFEKMFKSGAIKKLGGSLSIETYASHEPDGSLCRLAAMCPSAPAWRDMLLDTVLRLFTEYHMSAVYIDQVAASGISICCDPSHNHPSGNGRWWPRAFRTLMERLRQEKPEECGFTTESNAECFADQFDGFLTWAWVTTDLVPFFPYVYAGRIAMLGRNTNGYKKVDKQYCRFHIGQAVMFGQQIGWINADVVDDPDKIDYLYNLCHARWDTKAYYSEGRMLRPPVITAGNSTFVSDCSMGYDGLSEADVVLASGWAKEEGVLIGLTNTGDEQAVVTACFDPAEYGAGAVKNVHAYGDCELIDCAGGIVKAKLGARSCLMIEKEA